MTAIEFSNLLVRHNEFLRPYAFSLTQHPEDASDLCQETMLRALLNRDKYRFGTNLKAWLCTIMKNIFINHYRRKKKYGPVTGNIPGETYQYEKGQAAWNQGWSHLRLAEIRAAVDRLPGIFRLSFELHYTGYKYQEIADLLDEPLGTVKSRIHFARKTLMSRLDR